MEVISKAAAAAICACVLSLIIKKTNPELSVLMSLTVICVVLSAALSAVEGAFGVISEVKSGLAEYREYLIPVMKCAGIGIITGCVSRLCRDCAQSAAASAVELAGTMCAAAAAAPMINAAMKLIGGLI